MTIEATVISRMPDNLRLAQRTSWVDANKPGHVIDFFLEGRTFTADARIEVTHCIRSPTGHTGTHVAFRPGTNRLVMTESQNG